MTEYVCKKCKKKFSKKYNYNLHLNRKTNCIAGSKTRKYDRYECDKCSKTYSRQDSLQRHSKVCQKNIIKTKIKGNKNINIHSVNGNNTAIIESPIMINLIVFTKDGIDNLNSKELSEIFKSDKNLFESIISKVNFNPEKPQHHNVYYPDLKSSYGVIYEKNKWVKKKINEILNSLLDAKTEDLNEILNDFGDFLNKKTRNNIKEAIEHVDYTKPNHRKKLMAYLKPILYNNKEMIIKTRKMTENNNYYDLDDINDLPKKNKKYKYE